MHKILPLLFLFLSFNTILAHAQTAADTTWRRSFSAGVNLNQASFSDNWKAGGVNSVAVNAFLNSRADYKWERVSWDNSMQLQYGIVKNEGEGMRKSIDRIFLDSKYGYGFSTDWNTFVSANFLSQFAPGYEYDVDDVGTDRLISNFFSPAFLTFALGAEYKPNPNFSLRLSPFAPRFTFLLDEDVAVNERYGVPEGDKVRTEWLAAMIQADYQKTVMTNVDLKVHYNAFINYKELSFKRVDHRVNLVLAAKVNKYINVNLMGNLIYDYDQDSNIQYSQSLGLGVLYTLQGFSTGQ
ncbi:DUF3078 domain-containing protein [Rufibacter roseus]|uniref:DUF3078 domain-containing protein n=1 Tax=Rufibacter roseus TaxID=1567108 RepID=A0ABW2DNV8_9BACT|nr:DUF3078 domain-containing protein [Rufibacter roseus]